MTFPDTNNKAFELLENIYKNTLLPSDAFLLHFCLFLPLPFETKLFLFSQLSRLSFLELFFVFLLLVLFFSLMVSFLKFFTFLFPLFPSPQRQIIELTFPADTRKSSYATEKLYTLFHSLSRQVCLKDRILKRKKCFSLEIVSSKKEGIRFLISIENRFVDIVSRSLVSYIPGIKIKKVKDYLDFDPVKNRATITELKLSSHFALPLSPGKTLSESDIVSFLTGNMTNLSDDEIISFQIIISPVVLPFHKKTIREIKKIRQYIYRGENLTGFLNRSTFFSLPVISFFLSLFTLLFKFVLFIFKFFASMVVGFFNTRSKSIPFLSYKHSNLNSYEKDIQEAVKSKIDSELFEASVRLFSLSPDPVNHVSRINGVLACLGQLETPFQSYTVRQYLPEILKLKLFSRRKLSFNLAFDPNPVLSVSEVSDLFHFPFRNPGRAEGTVKSFSRELPVPLSLKSSNLRDCVFAKNTYAGTQTNIGLTDSDRSRHVFILGQTGCGKSTIIFNMAKDDIKKGRGVCVVDPHGDLAEELVQTIPEKRINDFVYLNPFDIKHPIAINLLELKPNLEGFDLEQEKELVCEGVISVFRRVFYKDQKTNSHKIEYILRNTIYSAFYVENPTVFTIYDLLNNPKYQKQVVGKIKDKNLRNFWEHELGRAGNYQAVKMASGVTAKVGRFLFSPTARRILEKPKSSIDFDDIINSGKILICNLSEGKLGEDTSQLIGTTVVAKLQQAFLRRSRTEKTKRTPFYFFIDEFQNFAIPSFSQLLSGGRKFGLRLTLAEQSTSQQKDKDLVNVILANTGTVVCFRTASPVDAKLMLLQFAPYIKNEDIINLPRFKFYIKLSAVTPEEPFSGETIPIKFKHNPKKVRRLIKASRKNYAVSDRKNTPSKKTKYKQKPPKKYMEKNKKKERKKTLH